MDLIGKKVADKTTSISKEPVKELSNNNETEDVELTTNKKGYISPKERKQMMMN